MSRIYTSQSRGHVSLPRGTANYLSRVSEAVTIMAEIYSGPMYQKDLVKKTNIAGFRIQSILYQLLSRGMVTRSKRVPTAEIYYYDLTVIAKLWMMQHYPELITSKKQGVSA